MGSCKGHVPLPIPESLQAQYDYEAIHHQPKVMADFAKAMASQHCDKGRYVMEPSASSPIKLPFCHTVFAETYGAVVHYGDWLNGPRVTSSAPQLPGLPTLEQFKQLTKDASINRKPVILEAVRYLAAESFKPTLVLDGPLTLLSQIIGLDTVLRGYKKEPEVVHTLLAELTSDLLSYAFEAEIAGIGCVSFADPITAKSLLGPKVFEQLAQPHLSTFANELSSLSTRGIQVQVCPVLMTDSGCFEAFIPCCGSLNLHALI